MNGVARFYTVVAVAMLAVAPIATAQDVHVLTMRGAETSPEEAAALEKKVEEHPDDITSRTLLLGYYSLRRYRDDAAKQARRKHVLWLIENAPNNAITGMPEAEIDSITDPEGYVLAKNAWLEQTEKHADDVTVLGNAADFFLLPDRDLALNLLELAHELEPETPLWLEKIGRLHALDMYDNPPAKCKAKAAMALEYYEKALALSDPRSGRTLESLARSALIAEEFAKARGYAKQMLKQGASNWNSGNFVHYGNLILGSLALREGNVDEAKDRLLAAGKTAGSPQLNSFGPNMSLALELLEAGEQDVVLEYFELCKKFWEREELERWASEVRAGLTPDFGANLRY